MELESFPALQRLSNSSAQLLERSAKPFAFSPRQAVIQCGDSIGGTYLVRRGHLRIFIQDADGQERTLYRVRPGQTCILAINCTFSGVVYPAWVEAGDVSTEGIFIPSTTYRKLFDTEAEVRNFTIHVLSAWIYDLMTLIEEVSLGSMARRLAHLLVRRSDPAGVVRATHESLAADLGTAREVVSRHLGSFESGSLIRKGRGQIVVLDREGLLGVSAREASASRSNPRPVPRPLRTGRR